MTKKIQDIRCSLQKALELEFFTIPPYLSALYSLHENSNRESREVIQSVVMEEMLHMMLVANVLNAVGGIPVLYPQQGNKGKLKRGTYPAKIPHITGGAVVNLLPFSEEAVNTFIAIETPDEPVGCDSEGNFETIGEFYRDIINCLTVLCELDGDCNVFTGSKELQFHRKKDYYGGGGEVIAVHTLHDAIQALGQVMEQGEGRLDSTILSGNSARFGQPKDSAHYYRFKQIAVRRFYRDQSNVNRDPEGDVLNVDWNAVYPMQRNPPMPQNPNEAQSDFLKCYDRLLCMLELGLRGDKGAFAKSVTHMHALGHSVKRLVKATADDNKTLGAPFYYVTSA